ncbi:MAG TPA: hypothetical protein VI932_05245 [Bacteroidota bacterium]|nr:hypothetical protein [Bacteroidota bacterium]
MKKSSHQAFGLFLALIALSAVIALGLYGGSYYLTALELRPFRHDYAIMKPSGVYSHGLGIVGSLMIVVGVTTYMTRKRLRSLSGLGQLSGWLTFHIFLCLLGPILIVYHSTFKAGGIAAITLWTMVSIVSSGLLGRYLYAQIPRNLEGLALSDREIDEEIRSLSEELKATPAGQGIIGIMDGGFGAFHKPESLGETIRAFRLLSKVSREIHRRIDVALERSHLDQATESRLRASAWARESLVRKSLIVSQAGRLFHYWHVIHLPFSIIMFLTLAAHVTVVLLLGYTWIF